MEFGVVVNYNVVGFQVKNSNGSFSFPVVVGNFFIEIDCYYYAKFASYHVGEDCFDKLVKFLGDDLSKKVAGLVRIFDAGEFNRKLHLPTKKSCDKWDVEEVFAFTYQKTLSMLFFI